MSVSVHELEAKLTVCGISCPLSLTVHYIHLPSYPGDREQPEELPSVEILSIWRGEHVVNVDTFSREQFDAISSEILENV